MKTPSKTLFSLLAVIAVAFACDASANLVTNGGFETGDFTGWTQSGNTGFSGVAAGISNSGVNSAFFGPVDTLGFISQTVNTVAGATYDLSFFLANGLGKGGGESPAGGMFNQFQVFWNGVLILDLSNLPGSPFSLTSLTGLLATGGSSTITFGFRNDPDFFFLDDVSLELAEGNTVPETFSTLWLALPVVGMVGFSRLRRKES